eukprot:GHVQ01018246.1.p1 GENE.GHVQ01018246.1~~GHVQ01018246.1.p1  ORF type:complete len:159 (-),score=18.25 GHVQ01018246.1:748-1224(-)
MFGPFAVTSEIDLAAPSCVNTYIHTLYSILQCTPSEYNTQHILKYTVVIYYILHKHCCSHTLLLHTHCCAHTLLLHICLLQLGWCFLVPCWSGDSSIVFVCDVCLGSTPGKVEMRVCVFVCVCVCVSMCAYVSVARVRRCVYACTCMYIQLFSLISEC